MQNVAKSVPRQSIGTPTCSAESSTEEEKTVPLVFVPEVGRCQSNSLSSRPRRTSRKQNLMSKFAYRRKTSTHMTSTGGEKKRQ